ncbi:TPR-like protein [Saitoella complicata NRRL Y-17804]|uniref:Uncharacterized protein n=1 Tax=Saitoella complicata (strain BCRC 22490 / CBS 7301 / JCM 7358 / NBRC 10748 / NRRL Y-17804) TaxID=698492 RepID=A0A0E9NAV9_SAICN|nr:TPR-like protein [Saitoella complicata NRRL Y-17804]ODQ53836.1 TPR-like protein [Saitoella complicata NRRL Y-17804]GAO46959.1 hypothetical protein G7K_1176-t1 [Saitoella complicata NRRL Y-17804]
MFRAGFGLIATSLSRSPPAVGRSAARAPAVYRTCFPKGKIAPSARFYASITKGANTLERGLAALEKHDLAEAVTLFDQAITENPTEAAQAYVLLGEAHWFAGEKTLASLAWEEALRSPDIAPVEAMATHCNLGGYHLLDQRPELAKKHYNAAVELDVGRQDGEIRFNLGVCLERMGDLEGAIKYYGEAKELGVEKAAQFLINAGAKNLAAKGKKEQ